MEHMDMDMDMGGMDMGNDSSSTSSMMGMSDMAMTFFQSTSTPLFSMSWTPSGAGQYAGTCIFIIVLAVCHRFLQALGRVYFERPTAVRRQDKRDNEKGGSSEEDEEEAVTGRRNLGSSLGRSMRNNPFRVSTEVSRGVFDMVTSGVGYLLMLAVMTMNTGYFMSVLGGIFLGTFLVGRLGR